ncbi:MAG: hypothetical protein COC24_000245 [Alphaproteobacteria bacterium]|nr:hypothetical protein [Alphaproteobacteria bacterium]
MTKKIIFVHGFGGSDETWADFPKLLRDKLDCEVKLFSYKSFYWPLIGKSTSIANLAQGLLSFIKLNTDHENDEIIIIGHSLGGLIIKQMLVNVDLEALSINISRVIFFAVPHNGAQLASALKIIAFRGLKLRALKRDGNAVEMLNAYFNKSDFQFKYNILNLVGDEDRIVNVNSAQGSFRNTETITGADHTSIVKPTNTMDASFNWVLNHINSKKKLTKYENVSSCYYKEWILHENRSHTKPLAYDKSRLEAERALRDSLNQEKNLVRITGLSGLGKTRLIVDYLKSEGATEDQNILIFKVRDSEAEIEKSIKLAIRDKIDCKIVVENCSSILHGFIDRELSECPSKIEIITVDHEHKTEGNSPHIKLTPLETESIIEIIRRELPDFSEPNIQKLAKYVEGYPLLAILISNQFSNSEISVPDNLADNDFVEKLVNIGGKLNETRRNILEVCSLFNSFEYEGTPQKDSEQVAFILDLSGASLIDFSKLITNFQTHQIIDTGGQFARIIPKPFAISLASDWWEKTTNDMKRKLIAEIPEAMIESFCYQIRYLDRSQKVQDFVESLCDDSSPFGQAEFLLSNKGSKIFRSIVEVNPKPTSNLLFRVIKNLSDKEIFDIDREVRRNFIWALEMLVFHKDSFMDAAWCIFKLAQNETESYSNNASGLFSQLFRTHLSGTVVNYDTRLEFLKSVVSISDKNAVSLVVKAIEAGLSHQGWGRTVGAENQGTKQEIEEFKPKTYNEIFSYQKSLLRITVDLIEKERNTEELKVIIGNELGNLINVDMINDLDVTVKKITSLQGTFWPSAYKTINETLERDSSDLSPPQINALTSWKKILAPSDNNIDKKLKYIVLDPSWDYTESDDGEYIDIAAQKARSLAKEIAKKPTSLIPHLELLLSFKIQTKSWEFGSEFAQNIKIDEFLEELLKSIRNTEELNCSFVVGFLNGLFSKNEPLWLETMKLFSTDGKLQKCYPYIIRSGTLTSEHLSNYAYLMETGVVSSSTAFSLSHGQFTKKIPSEDMAKFCKRIMRIDSVGVWVALENLNFYIMNSDYNQEIIDPVLKEIIFEASFNGETEKGMISNHNWKKSVELLLKNGGYKFAEDLCVHFLDQKYAQKIDYTYSSDYINPILISAFEYFADDIWPVVSKKILSFEPETNYRISSILDGGMFARPGKKSIFTFVNRQWIVDWCKSEAALKIVTESLPIFENDMSSSNPFNETNSNNSEEKTVNSLLVKLISVYGEKESFRDRIKNKLHTRSWSGSIVPYLEAEKKAIVKLLEYNNSLVKDWAQDFISHIESEIEYQISREEKNNIAEKFNSNF